PSGVTEAEVASELVYRMQKNGATGPSFHTIVGSGPNGAEPHYTAASRKIEPGDMIVIDFGAAYHMYCSDITRTVVVGKASEEQRRMHETVARAQAAAFAKMKPGSTAKSVDAAARSLIDRSKYKGRFIHGLGHSIRLAGQDAHPHHIDEPAILVNILAMKTFPLEAEPFVGVDRTDVVLEDVQGDFVQPEDVEGVSEGDAHRLRSVSFRPERRFADHDP